MVLFIQCAAVVKVRELINSYAKFICTQNATLKLNNLIVKVNPEYANVSMNYTNCENGSIFGNTWIEFYEDVLRETVKFYPEETSKMLKIFSTNSLWNVAKLAQQTTILIIPFYPPQLIPVKLH